MHISKRRFLNLVVFLYAVTVRGATQTEDSLGTKELTTLSSSEPEQITTVTASTNSVPTTDNPANYCPDNVMCGKLSGGCLSCDLDRQCHYGAISNVTCRAKTGVVCLGAQEFLKPFTCRYCYQTDRSEQFCSYKKDCQVTSAPRQYYQANCTVHPDIICLGNRQFPRMLPCNWSSGKRWSTALALSITVGGFGADRFYLGHWREGIGKLFSFGGLGVWTLVDVVLVGVGYVGPADESLYIY